MQTLCPGPAVPPVHSYVLGAFLPAKLDASPDPAESLVEYFRALLD